MAKQIQHQTIKDFQMENTNPLVIKKTFQETYDTLLNAGVPDFMGSEAFNDMVKNQFVAKTSTGPATPREVTILRDVDQNILGRKCMLANKWFSISEFFKGTSVIKTLDQEKAKIYNAAKKLEKEANTIRDEAKTAETPEERLALYDKYEDAIDAAKAAQSVPVDAKIVAKAAEGGLDTIEDLASALGVVLGETANIPKPAEAKKEATA